MRLIALRLPIAACLLIMMTGCGSRSAEPEQQITPSVSSPAQETGPAGTGTASPEASPSPAPSTEEQVAAMPLEQKLGQLVLAGVEGTRFDERMNNLLATGHVGGIILYKSNLESVEQATALLNELKTANRVNQAPLFLSVDQEGGRVNRLPAPLMAPPSSRDVARTGQSGSARIVGEAIGDELGALGFNVNFAPVLDVDSNPANPVIGNRSFGSTSAIVSAFGIEEMQGLRAKGIIPVVKHFPGHGDTSVDSHLELPVVGKTLAQLQKLELVPFGDAIQAEADAMMVAHILLPEIDPDRPASMSSAVITGLLRDEMGFDGVVITDDMTMGAIKNHFDLGEAAVAALAAGSDIVLVGHDYDQAKRVLNAIRQAAEEGVLSPEAIDQSVRRILELKKRYGLSDVAAAPVDVNKLNKLLKPAFEGFTEAALFERDTALRQDNGAGPKASR